MSPPRFRAFGVGCAKTGTNSLAGMFQRHYRAAHEPQVHALIGLILERPHLSEAAFGAAVRALLDPLDLEMNASQLNGYIVETMVALYPDARFILTLREPRSWLRSFANHQMTRGRLKPGSPWARFRDLRFLAPGETATGGNGLYSIDQYLGYWLSHNVAVMRAVPPERLLVVRTERLDDEIARLAAFLDIAPDSLVPAHANGGSYEQRPALFDDDALAAAAARYAARLREMTGFGL